MRCKYCGHGDSKVVDSRPTEEGTAIRRRRECQECGRRFTTYEKVESLPVRVIKKDGRREPFDGDKLMNGIIKACEKRPIPMASIERLADEVEREILRNLDQEVQSQAIGELVMSKLKALDEVAYVRYASVYRSFKDLNTFMSELKAMLGEGDEAKR